MGRPALAKSSRIGGRLDTDGDSRGPEEPASLGGRIARLRAGAKRVAAAIRGTQARWRGLTPVQKRFAKGLLFAVGIEAVFLAVHHHPFLAGTQALALDSMMRIYRGILPERPVPPFVFVEIDDATHEEWGAPPVLPRERIAQLLAGVLAGAPRMVLVDFDLTFRAGGEEELQRVLEGARASAGGPPILLTRSGSARVRRHGLPEALVAESDGRDPLHLTSVLFPRELDGTIRYWRMWEAACAGTAEPVVPAMPLLAAVLLQGDPEERSLARLETAMRYGAMVDCDEGHGAAREEPRIPPVRFGDLELSFLPGTAQQRIVYRLPWRLEEGERWPALPGSGRPWLDVVPARALLGPDPPHPGRFHEAVVVLGGSFAEGRDVYATPLGEMPGALVIVNAVSSILAHGQLRPLAGPWRAGLLLVEMVIVAFCFARWPGWKGFALSVGFVALALVPLSAYLFQGGVWLDFSLPFLAVRIHNWLPEGRHRAVEGA
jgi:CHASE2 domain-containing sensor protein